MKVISREHQDLLQAALEVRESIRAMLASGTMPTGAKLARLADRLTQGIKARASRRRLQQPAEDLRAWVAEHNEEALMADGFEDALLGIAERCSQPPLVVYDAERCIQILMERSGMDEEEAEEFFSFNTLGAWMGEHTPLFLWRRDST